MWQAEYFQVLLDAPGIRPTAICLIRTGDELDWLSVSQIHKILLSKSVHQSTVSGRARTGQESTGKYYLLCSVTSNAQEMVPSSTKWTLSVKV